MQVCKAGGAPSVQSRFTRAQFRQAGTKGNSRSQLIQHQPRFKQQKSQTFKETLKSGFRHLLDFIEFCRLQVITAKSELQCQPQASVDLLLKVSALTATKTSTLPEAPVTSTVSILRYQI